MRRDEFPIIDKFAEQYAEKKVREFAEWLCNSEYTDIDVNGFCKNYVGETPIDRSIDEVLAEWQKSVEREGRMINKKLILTVLRQLRETYKYNQYAYTALVEAINEVEKIGEIKA